MNNDGYPLDDTLQRIKEWPVSRDTKGLVAYIKNIWHWGDWGIVEESGESERPGFDGVLVDRLILSTGGWSGNEEIIDAMRLNYAFWMFYWRVHRVGGHYTFEFPV